MTSRPRQLRTHTKLDSFLRARETHAAFQEQSLGQQRPRDLPVIASRKFAGELLKSKGRNGRPCLMRPQNLDQVHRKFLENLIHLGHR